MASTGGNSAPLSATPSSSPSSRGDSHRGRGRGGGSNARGRGRGGTPAGNAITNSRGRGGRGRGRGNGSIAADAAGAPAHQPADARLTVEQTKDAATVAQPDDNGEGDGEVCFICANPVVHHSIAPCNHTTCHICGLRMRALYKTVDCAHCRTPAPFVVFSDNANKRYEEYTDADITTVDTNIGIRYANEDIVGDTVLLLRYNCPDSTCDFAGLGWPDLHRHVRSVHRKRMCDLCTRNKKVFTHEHDLFNDKELEKHMKVGDDRPGDVDQTGFKGHPLCEFCGQRFFDSDKLFEHCRLKHERCFICDRRDPRQQHYFQDYNGLEKHFRDDHFLCLDKECLEKKFIVFASEIDLKAHQLDEHGNSLSKDVRRDARVVDMSAFDYRPSYQQERRGGGQNNREPRDGRGRGRGRDPNAEPLPASSAQPLRRDELAFQRQLAIHSAQSVSNRSFGAQLSAPPTSSAPHRPTSPRSTNAAPAAPPGSAQAAPLFNTTGTLSAQDNASLGPQDRARMVRHGAVIERAANLLGNDSAKIATFREHISSYNNGKLTAPLLVDAIFTLFADASHNALGTLVREIADLFEDPAKAVALRGAWQDWRAINEDYPSLPGLGGMHGATTASSGWAAAATASPTAPAAAPSQKHSTRVLRLKNSTRRSSTSSVASGSSWSGPSQPPSQSAFPALSSRPAPLPTVRPTWATNASSSAVASRASVQAPSPAPRPRPAQSRPATNEEAFPALPAAPKPMTTIFGYGTGAVRRNVGSGQSTGFSWGQTEASGTGSGAASGQEDETGDGTGKKKKGNKGKKQVLVQWG